MPRIAPQVPIIQASRHENDQLRIIFLFEGFMEYFDLMKKNKLNITQKTQSSRLAISPQIYLLIMAHSSTNTTLGIHMTKRSFQLMFL